MTTLPLRISRPRVSTMIAIVAPAAAAASRILATMPACDTSSPCDMLSRATFMPASIIAFNTAGELQAGPMVAITLVFLNFLRGIRTALEKTIQGRPL